jgi:GT2 family glycosyltransferase
VHSAGGRAGFYESDGIRGLYEHTEHSMTKLDSLKPQLRRCETEVAEFHCVMIRRDAFDRVGIFDEGLKNTREHTDFCLRVRQAGGKVVLEPESVISYVTAPPFEWSDLPLYLFRWSKLWNDLSLKRINENWGLNDDYHSLRTNWLTPQRQAALRPLRNGLVRLIGKRAGDAAVDFIERRVISSAMRKRRLAGLDTELY